ncbi:hypothetical protein ACH5RR_039133 [Cinchona calisaya]|uniref:Uncharacterized protein n=1 Tax=Cinchona calisaya TaxID=153742 RepID=A0ABD2Y1H1_9GENT
MKVQFQNQESHIQLCNQDSSSKKSDPINKKAHQENQQAKTHQERVVEESLEQIQLHDYVSFQQDRERAIERLEPNHHNLCKENEHHVEKESTIHADAQTSRFHRHNYRTN